MTIQPTVGRQGFMRTWRRATAPRLVASLRFAQALVARHGLGTRVAQWLDMRLAMRPRAGLLTLQLRGEHTTTLIERNLQTPLQHTKLVRLQPRSHHAGDVRPAARREGSAPLLAGVPVPALLAAPFVQRVIARGTRTEALPGERAQAVQAMPASRVGDAPRSAALFGRVPVELALVKPRLADAPAAVRPVAPAEPVPALRPVPHAVTAAPAQPLPPQEIERITAQVMGSIDRRILAERERHGRF